ncbi:MAG: hypothetical protein IPM27_09630 [Nitrosomonadales bacterium]|nr:hypothetical protein [Nitrosomonadales bacterium]
MSASLAKAFSCDIDESNLPVRAEQLRARLRSYPLLIAGQAVIALLLVELMWGRVPHVTLLSWIATLFAFLLVEIFMIWRYRKEMGTLEECRRWRTRFVVLVSCVGAVWGAGGLLLFVPGDLAYQAMLICVVLGVAAGAATTNPVFPPALYIFVTLLILPIIAINVAVGDRSHLILAAMLVVYLFFVLNAGKDLGRTFEQSLRGRLENERLVGQLTWEKQRAEQASLMKSKFLAAASHDLRQPMHALTLFVEALKGHVNGREGVELVGQIDRSVEVLGTMFDALLDISKLDAGVVQPHEESFAIQAVLDRMHAEFSRVAQGKGLRFVVADSDLMVYSDPLLLERILRNLITNAIRYTEQGEVAIVCRQEGDDLELEVSDTGIGIAQEHLPHIFEEYYQVGNQHRDRSKGLGLGLSIVKRIEQLLGYRMKVKSILGGGSSFILQIPMRAGCYDCQRRDRISEGGDVP